MKKLWLLITLIGLFSVNAFAQMMEQPITWRSSLEKVDGNVYEVLIQGEIADTQWHIYDLGPYEGGPNPTVLTVETNGNAKIVGKPYIKTKVVKHMDEMFGMEIGYCEEKVVVAQKIELIKDTETEILAVIEWQACNNGSCLPPTDQEFKIKLPAMSGAAAGVAGAAEKPAEEKAAVDAANTGAQAVAAAETGTASETAVSQTEVKSSSDKAASDKESGSLWGMIIEAIIWGFVALLTPCVFPMVPMTVSFFLKGSQGASKAQGKFKAAFFGFSIVALYTLPIAIIILVTYFAGGESVTADIFNWLATHWIPNLIFFAIFMIFAASFFGAFEITLPSSMVNKSDSKSDKGGLIGVFFMALTLVLVSFSCTGPIVGTVLIKSTQGEIWEPIITMFAFSCAFALPFTIFAFAPSLLKDLPKSGGWLNSVKVVLGFIEVALGFKFLSVADQTYHWGLIDREIYLAIWIVCFSLMGLYLLGKIRFAHDTPIEHLSVTRLVLSIVVFTFVVYMIPGMWGAPLKALSGYLPPITSQDFVLTSGGTASVTTSSDQPAHTAKYSDFLHLPNGIQGYFHYGEALEAAKKANKPLFVDFTGHGCVNCREMEQRVWADPRVLKMLKEDFIVVALYADDKKEVAEEDWVTLPSGRVLKQLGKINSHFAMERFNVNAQPYYTILDPFTEEPKAEPRGYNLDVDAFIKFLQDGLK